MENYRVAKMHGMPYFHRSFPAKEPYMQKSPRISGSFAERDLKLKASNAFLPPCIAAHIGKNNRNTFLLSRPSLRYLFECIRERAAKGGIRFMKNCCRVHKK